MLQISESINVWVLFSGSQIKPHTFFWKGRQIRIEKVNLVHTSKDGFTTFYHFSVSSGENFYRLKFDTKILKWFLEEVEEG